ncbi:hypothetical protein ACPCKW_24765, partial [Streptomyces griseoincarnatus]
MVAAAATGISSLYGIPALADSPADVLVATSGAGVRAAYEALQGSALGDGREGGGAVDSYDYASATTWSSGGAQPSEPSTASSAEPWPTRSAGHSGDGEGGGSGREEAGSGYGEGGGSGREEAGSGYGEGGGSGREEAGSGYGEG